MATFTFFQPIPETAPSPVEGTISNKSSTGCTLKAGLYKTVWQGNNITYNSLNEPITGTATGFEYFKGTTLYLRATNMNKSIAVAHSLPSDEAVINYILNGNDTGNGSAFNDVIGLGAGNDTINGAGGADQLFGDLGNDVLRGGIGNDRLFGENGADTLEGGAGADTLHGGLGKDRHTGGFGADRFDFNAIAESPRGINRDVIADFRRSEGDKIDLSTIDANGTAAGNGVFKFVGSTAFSGDPGDLRFSGGILSGDTNGEKVADFEIRILGVTSLQVTDIIR